MKTNHAEGTQTTLLCVIAPSPVEPALDFDLSWLALGRFGFSEMSPVILMSECVWVNAYTC